MSTPLNIDIEVATPAVDVEIDTPTMDVSAGTGGAQVVLLAVPGPPGPPGPPGSGTSIFGETPAGVQDGVNTVFTLANTPQPGAISLYRNGLREYLDVGFSVTGATITISAAPLPSDEITADYLME